MSQQPLDNKSIHTFNGQSHRLFIEGRGFDFLKLKVNKKGFAILSLKKSDNKLYTLLDFEEPRFIYVVSKSGNNDLILQGSRIEEIVGDSCVLSYSKLQLDA